ncbi:MAG: zf-HC2 domain-containing protein [Pyrinomonadaceae bacterium]|nr:zf-HC2 domain-containing protein [Pyrinomonadaceae bacterium]
MKCRDFHELIDSYLSDELLTETNHNVLRHLEDCVDCRNVIEARRAVRTRLKAAVSSSAKYGISESFSRTLESQLKESVVQTAKTGNAPWFGRNNWIALAAGLILTFTVGFFLLNSDGTGMDDVADRGDYSVKSLSSENIVNIASGDHEHCAIRHRLDEAPITLVEASADYNGIESVVAEPLKAVLSDYRLVEAHACKYLDTRFAHLVLANEGGRVSVLITDLKDGKDGREVENFSTKKYQIARFNTRKRSVFVISDLDREQNSKAAEALFVPIRRHFDDDTGDPPAQTALLTMY